MVANDLRIEEVVLTYGGRAADWSREFERELPFRVEHLVITSLEYDDLQTEEKNLNLDIRKAFAARGYDRESTILHAHNHALGKNAALPTALNQFGLDGWRILLQLHDFVEDLRPANYTHLLAAHSTEQELWGTLYPQSPHVRYATLNQSDHAALVTAGVDDAQIDVVPNPVENESLAEESSATRAAARRKLSNVYGVPAEKPYVLYPVRGIRRKNLGEILLWSRMIDNCTFSISLEPTNAHERESFLFWKDFSESHSLDVRFGSGKHLSLDENYAAADAIISTSVAEGFGLVFLEAALRNRLLFGRDLPGVTADFVSNGLQFPGLADALLVPTSAFDVTALQSAYERFSKQLGENYRCPTNRNEIDQQLTELCRRSFLDFGRLDQLRQTHVIAKATSDSELLQSIIERNPVVERVRRTLVERNQTELDTIAKNQTAIRQHYSYEMIGRNLVSIYRKLLECETNTFHSRPDIGRNLLRHFVRPQHLVPVRIES